MIMWIACALIEKALLLLQLTALVIAHSSRKIGQCAMSTSLVGFLWVNKWGLFHSFTTCFYVCKQSRDLRVNFCCEKCFLLQLISGAQLELKSSSIIFAVILKNCPLIFQKVLINFWWRTSKVYHPANGSHAVRFIESFLGVCQSILSFT